jgi:hypothetical protein
MKKFFMLAVLILFCSGIAHAFEFSADTVITAKEGKTTGKIFYKADRFRMDMKTPEEMTMITRMDKKVVWNIMPREKMYMEIPFSMQNRPRVDDKVEGEIERKLIGSETVDGHPTKKYLITYQSGKAKEQMYQWWATDINFPVKSSAVDGSWVQEYKNITFGSQPNSLFELPTGYQKFQMPGGMNFNMK